MLLAPMAATGAEADRLDGHRHPGGRAVPAAAAALRLLQPAVRPGHQPAAGRDPGGAGHLAGRPRSARSQPAGPRRRRRAGRSCCRSRCWTTTSWPSSSHINADGNLPGFAATVRGPVRGGRRRRGAGRRRSTGAGRGRRRDRRRRPDHHAVRPATPTPTQAPIPSLLLTSAVHHHLVRERPRTKVGLVVESGDAREVHHIALLIGYGAGAVNPYLALETVEDLVARRPCCAGVDPAKARQATTSRRWARACSR